MRRQTGAEWLAAQDEATQRKVLGDAGAAAYRAGRVTLQDFLGQRQSVAWGTSPTVRSLASIVGPEEARRWAGVRRADLTRARWDELPDEELIPAVVRSEVQPEERHLRRIGEYVAGRGFEPGYSVRVDRRLVGYEWQGTTLASTTELPTAEAHFLKHVLVQEEFPPGTTLEEYLQFAREICTDGRNGIAVGKYHGRYQVSFVGWTGKWRGPRGAEWVTVEYNVASGYWGTMFQLREGLDYIEHGFRRTEVRWLRQPQAHE